MKRTGSLLNLLRKMGQRTFLLIFLFCKGFLAAKKCKNVVQEVRVVVQVSDNYPTLVEDYFTRMAAHNLIKYLHEKKEGRCWKLKSTHFDSEISNLERQGPLKRILRDNIVKKNDYKGLDNILDETLLSMQPTEKLTLLVLGQSNKTPELLVDNAIGLLDYNYIFVMLTMDVDNLDRKTKVNRSEKQRSSFDNSRKMNKRHLRNVRNNAHANNARAQRSLFDGPFLNFAAGTLLQDIVFAPIYSEYEKCKQPVDVGFILDASGSLFDEYTKMKHFIQGLAKTFDVSEDGTHAAVVQFSKNAEHVIKLNDYTNSDNFNAAVSKLIPYLLTTRIDRGLQIARDELFLVENGGRPNMKKLVILITDGKQTRDVDYVKPEDIAAAIRKKGIAILVIGVGDQVDDNELQSIAGPNDNWRKARDFDELRSKEFVEKMTRKACDIPYTEQTCEAIVDIAFLIDASGSIDKYTDFKQMKEFVTRIANTFQLSEDGARAGIVVFSDYIDESRSRYFTMISGLLENGKSSAQFRKAVENSRHIGYRTRIDLAFKLAEKEIFNPHNGARPNVKKIIILLTDGKQTPDIPKYDPIQASEGLYKKGVKIYAIGIGHLINHAQLEAITRRKHRVFYAQTFKALESQEFVQNVSTTACTAAYIRPPLSRKSSGNPNFFNSS